MLSQQERIRTILGLCVRVRGHQAMYEMLAREIEIYIDQQHCLATLIHHAERQGIAPLFYTHISAIDMPLPGKHHRVLRSLYQRSRHANRIRNRVMAEILPTFATEHIDVMLIKGIALASTVYGEAGLRPMRDIDLLVRKEDLEATCSILSDYGFIAEPHHQSADDYYHLPPIHRTIDGLPVTIEIHHELLPRQAPYPLWTYVSFSDDLMPFSIEGEKAATINLETNLYYLYLHGIKAPLTYEPFRLIHVADLVNIVEGYHQQIDWNLAEKLFPSVKSVLSQFHSVSPWTNDLIEVLELNTGPPLHRPPRPYQGWPLIKIHDTPATQLPALLKETVYPSSWWLRTYYGGSGSLSYLRTLLFEHPRSIWRWMKTYARARSTQH